MQLESQEKLDGDVPKDFSMWHFFSFQFLFLSNEIIFIPILLYDIKHVNYGIPVISSCIRLILY